MFIEIEIEVATWSIQIYSEVDFIQSHARSCVLEWWIRNGVISTNYRLYPLNSFCFWIRSLRDKILQLFLVDHWWQEHVFRLICYQRQIYFIYLYFLRETYIKLFRLKYFKFLCRIKQALLISKKIHIYAEKVYLIWKMVIRMNVIDVSPVMLMNDADPFLHCRFLTLLRN